MSGLRRARDVELLDALDALERISFEGEVWRAILTGRDPLAGHPSKGRWDPGTFDVIYYSLEREGALAELHFHLSRQPVFPSKSFTLHRVAVQTRRTLRFADLSELLPLGVTDAEYSSLLYQRTQDIGDAAAFLGFDGIIPPGARWECLNLVVFSDRLEPEDLELVSSSLIDWESWRSRESE